MVEIINCNQKVLFNIMDEQTKICVFTGHPYLIYISYVHVNIGGTKDSYS